METFSSPSPARLETDSRDHFTVCMLAGGSKGNSMYISDGHTSLLIDAGLSGIEIQRRLASRGISPESLDAIVVSHEHDDHIHGVGVLSRRFQIPVYINSATHRAAATAIGKLHRIHHFQSGATLQIKTISLQPFYISHDASDPSAFTLQKNSLKIGIATDLGIVTNLVRQHLKNCRLLVLEANHDPAMLTHGPYPWHLKQRIKSRNGHLSNEDAGHLLKAIAHEQLQHVILSHLSEKNNTPEIAMAEVGRSLSRSKTRLTVATQDKAGPLIQVATE